MGRSIILLLRNNQGISSGCHHATQKLIFSGIVIMGRWKLCFCLDLAKVFLQGAIMPPQNSKIWNCNYCVKGALFFCFELARVFIQGATTPTLHQFFIFRNCHYCGKGALSFCFDITKVFLQGANMPTLHHFFKNFHYCGKGALCFSFDLAKVFPQGATCHPTPIFMELLLLQEWGIMH